MLLLKERFMFGELFQEILLMNEIFMLGKYQEIVSPW